MLPDSSLEDIGFTSTLFHSKLVRHSLSSACCLYCFATNRKTNTPEVWAGIQIHGPCKTIRTMNRPVPLEWHFAYSLRKKAEIDALFKETNKMNPKIRPRIKR